MHEYAKLVIRNDCGYDECKETKQQ